MTEKEKKRYCKRIIKTGNKALITEVLKRYWGLQSTGKQQQVGI